MKQYFLILLICGIAYIVPQHLQFSENGLAFLATNAVWSTFVIFCLLHIGNTELIITICLIEFFALCVNLGAAVGYLTDYEYFLSHYGTIINGLNLIEVATLILWMGINGFLAMDNASSKFSKFIRMVFIHRMERVNGWCQSSLVNKGVL